MDKVALEALLQEITHSRDDGQLHDLVNSLSAEELQLYKKELAAAYLEIYAVWHYDYICDKVTTTEGPASFIGFLLELLAEADKLDPEQINYEQRASCYLILADLKTSREEQLDYLEKAAREIRTALLTRPGSSELNNQLVVILLAKIKAGNQYREEDFAEALTCFEQGLLNYSSDGQLNLIYNCFEILNMPFPRNRYWHHEFLEKLQAVLTVRAEKDRLIYLEWVNGLKRIIENHDGITPEYALELTKQSVQLLKRLTGLDSTDQETLNKLGAAFSNVAEKLGKAGYATDALEQYEVAVKYYSMAQAINPAAWTYPVYATNALMAMAAVYHERHNKAAVLALFERGQQIFLKIYKPEEDFTANLYWGKFLINFARLVYDFNSPVILQQAEEKLLQAQELGRQYYSHPYIARAKVALKMGDREKCLAILRECKKVFTHDYSTYSLSEVIADEDFAVLKPEIVAIDHA